MPVSIPRLRIWFAVMGLAIVAVVAGFYIYARLQLRMALKNLPGKVGINIQQTTEGFTLSKSEGGHTLFTIHASRATQFKQGGRAELHNVNIIVYGRNSDRYDQIYGDDFEYDQQAGTVSAKGEVHIDLEGNTQGRLLGDQAPPRELQNPIHLQAQGLTFNQKTGLAQTDGRIEFRVPQASGSAEGATYDSHKNELLLHSAVDIQTESAQPTRIKAGRGSITKEPRVLVLDMVQLEGSQRKLQSHRAVVNLAEDNAIKHVEATGDVRLSDEGGLNVRAPRADLQLAEQNTVQSALFTGGVDFESEKQAANGHSGEMLMRFAPAPKSRKRNSSANSATASVLQNIYASKGVTLHRAAQQTEKNPQAFAITSPAMTFAVGAGRLLTSAQTEGPGQIVMNGASAKNIGEQTKIDAQHFKADFGDQNRLNLIRGNGAVRVTSHIPGQPDKVSTSENIVAQFNPGGEISRIVQDGGFRYVEGQSSKNEPGGRTSTADRAIYSPQDDALTLQGSPRIVDGGMTLTADSIRLLRRGGEAFAQGNVKTTYSELKVQPNGALLATSDPVHVTAHAMNAAQLTGLAHYTGGARLWQGSNIVEAQSIDFDQKARTIVAHGDRRRPVSSVFLQVDGKGKATTMVVTAPNLNYADQDRQAHYSGGVTARGEDAVLTADRIDVFLNPANASRVGVPSQLDHITASNHVLVQQQERRAEGEKLVYTASAGSFVLTGGPPILSDPVNGTVRGDSLTFFSHDDRVVVEGNGSSRAVTRTHVSR